MASEIVAAGRLKKFIRSLLLAPIALFLLFEQWGWVPLAAAFATLGRLPVWRQLERVIARLPPWAALLAFGIPVLALIPVKLLALYLIGEGRIGMGVALILGAKLVGTAIAARLFQLTQPALMQLKWFARSYTAFQGWKDRILSQARSSWPWRAAHGLKRRAVYAWQRFKPAIKAAAAKWR